jgi:sugar O-acyltransferase (sialic acid O-acetyltransferase NeuD family)
MQEAAIAGELMEKVAIFGASGHAAVVIDAAEKQGAYEIAGLITNETHPGHNVLGHGILGGDDDVEALLAAQHFTLAFLAIGDNAIRQRIAERLSTRLPALSYATIIHPSAIVGSEVSLGVGSFVAAGAVVGPRTSVGRHCIINTRASIDHDCDMHDFASVAPGVVMGGRCSIGIGTHIGIGATLIQGRKIGPDTVIGAGALVMQDIEPRVVAYGLPAAVVRRRVRGDGYL